MSTTLRKSRDFLKLLLSTTKDQARALFHTLTPIQTLAICEIAINIQNLPLTKKIVRELQKRKFLFKWLGDKSIKVQNKLELIQTHYRQVQSSLLLIKNQILSLLE